MKQMVEAKESRFERLTHELARDTDGQLEVRLREPLSMHTRFGIGGPADVLVIAADSGSFIRALDLTRASGLPWVVIGGGTNLIVSDAGFRGVVLQFAANAIVVGSEGLVLADAGAVLQNLVDRTIAGGWKGLETMTGIPGWVGAAVYGNAGAYGHSISERIAHVTYFDGDGVATRDAAACEFRYRESIFKREKDWIILSCLLRMDFADAAGLKREADAILQVRNAKYPPEMKCAGSIFKNFLFAELPAGVQRLLPGTIVREGKVPSAWFLEQVGAKGLRVGDIQVADYHANLIYNDGFGTARDLLAVIGELQQRIRMRFGIPLEEEVQYVGDFTAG